MKDDNGDTVTTARGGGLRWLRGEVPSRLLPPLPLSPSWHLSLSSVNGVVSGERWAERPATTLAPT
jgi:hypothetical protein